MPTPIPVESCANSPVSWSPDRDFSAGMHGDEAGHERRE
jgi:hypothetical protein